MTQHIVILEPAGTASRQSPKRTIFKNDGKMTYNDPRNGTLRFFAPAGGEGRGAGEGDRAGRHGRPARAGSGEGGGRIQAGFPDQAGRRDAHRHRLCRAAGGPGDVRGQDVLQGRADAAGGAERRDAQRRRPEVAGPRAADTGGDLRDDGRSLRRKDRRHRIVARAAGGGTETTAGGADDAAEEAGPSIQVITAPGFDESKTEILVLALAVLALGFVLLYRRGRAAATLAAKSRG